MKTMTLTQPYKPALQAASRPIHEKSPCRNRLIDCMGSPSNLQKRLLGALNGILCPFLPISTRSIHNFWLWVVLQEKVDRFAVVTSHICTNQATCTYNWPGSCERFASFWLSFSAKCVRTSLLQGLTQQVQHSVTSHWSKVDYSTIFRKISGLAAPFQQTRPLRWPNQANSNPKSQLHNSRQNTVILAGLPASCGRCALLRKTRRGAREVTRSRLDTFALLSGLARSFLFLSPLLGSHPARSLPNAKESEVHS